MSAVLVWSITAGVIAGMFLRPKQWPEAVWACLGTLLLVLFGVLSWPQAFGAIGKGTDVYLFLAGMMALASVARQEGVFDWLATLAVRAAKGSRTRLFTLLYVAGIAVTVFLSNDATAVVLTPPVYAAIKKARTEALPYLLICAFIANAASFVLPVSNPANLVVYGKTLPPLLPWLHIFLLPSACSIVATYIALRWYSRRHLEGRVEDGLDPSKLSAEGKRALWGIIAAGAVLIGASAHGNKLGLPTCLAAAAVVLISTRANWRTLREVMKGVSWSVLPLVAGLFVLVEALNKVGALADVGRLLRACSAMPGIAGSLAASSGAAALSNVMNNLPSGLLVGEAVRSVPVAARIRDSVLIGVDLGPNVSVTGSLATVLWLIALRREGEHITGWRFFKAGVAVMPPALVLATLAVWLMSLY